MFGFGLEYYEPQNCFPKTKPQIIEIVKTAISLTHILMFSKEKTRLVEAN